MFHACVDMRTFHAERKTKRGQGTVLLQVYSDKPRFPSQPIQVGCVIEFSSNIESLTCREPNTANHRCPTQRL